jgi:hypothetical protein
MAGDFIFTRQGKLHFYCPLCHHHQSTNTIQKVSWKHHGQMILATLALAIPFFPLLGFKGFSLYFFLWGSFEFFYRLRKRQALVCESCGFDPFLYKRDIQQARKALKQHWQNRIETEGLFSGIKLRNYSTKPKVVDSALLTPQGAAIPSRATASENAAPPAP